MLKVADDFQYSINIAYDLNDDKKLKNFIPTTSSIDFIEDVLLSTRRGSTKRARILIGAYGRGKSHIVLALLSLLQGKPLDAFAKAKSRFLEKKVFQTGDYAKNMLPVVISGSYESMTQAFLQSLHQTLRRNNLADVMSETNYSAALDTIQMWREKYKATFDALEKKVGDIKQYLSRLEGFDYEAYKSFCALYPSLTSGGEFNPFISSDVAEIYKNCSHALKSRGYSGIFVVYDEFSKYLESSITNTHTSDTKMLQDFAEMCNRSGDDELHLLLISHKEIANYIDKLPKQKTDGWRGISERFEHIHLNDTFSETYEIISQAIEKDEGLWKKFCEKYKDALDEETKECYPLHKVSKYILPRLSEKIAQNERTLFTFLSAQGKATLSEFLQNYDDESFRLLTPDVIYDYFEPILKKDFSFENHGVYTLTEKILAGLEKNEGEENSEIGENGENGEKELEEKIIKTISLICMLEQYEKLPPTYDTILDIFSLDYPREAIKNAISDLVEKKFVVYLRRSNSYLKLKEASGVNIKQEIADEIERCKSSFSLSSALNRLQANRFFYPYRYNDEKEMTRFALFSFAESFDECEEIAGENKADCYVFALLKHTKDEVAEFSKHCKSAIFVIATEKPFSENLPDGEKQPLAVAAAVEAVEELEKKAKECGDTILADEYEIIYDDVREMGNEFIERYTHPEKQCAEYLYAGETVPIRRKAELSDKLSDMCFALYPKTPVINNEVINKNEITSQVFSSRNKIISALLRRDIEENLGLLANGQDVSIMRSMLLRPHILSGETLTLHTGDDLLDNMLGVIEAFFVSCAQNPRKMSELYDELTGEERKIGLRRGVIPIYLAVVFHIYRKSIVIKCDGEEKPLSLETLLALDKSPEAFEMSLFEWDGEKEAILSELKRVFADYIVKSEAEASEVEYVYKAVLRYYLSLPKCVKELYTENSERSTEKKYADFVALCKKNVGCEEFLFSALPSILSVDEISKARNFFDTRLEALEEELFSEILRIFGGNIKEWTYAEKWESKECPHSSKESRLFSLFLSYSHEEIDKNEFIRSLVFTSTALDLEYLDEKSIDSFKKCIEMFKNTVETSVNASDNDIKLETAPLSPRSKLLFNKISDALDTFAESLSVAEKRQVLINALHELC